MWAGLWESHSSRIFVTVWPFLRLFFHSRRGEGQCLYSERTVMFTKRHGSKVYDSWSDYGCKRIFCWSGISTLLHCLYAEVEWCGSGNFQIRILILNYSRTFMHVPSHSKNHITWKSLCGRLWKMKKFALRMKDAADATPHIPHTFITMFCFGIFSRSEF